jgi:hypothetical protein
MSDTRSRTLARDRQRAHRARQRVGLMRYTVELDEVTVEAALVGTGLLPEARADDREAAAAIFTKLLTRWLERRSVTRDNVTSTNRVDLSSVTQDGRKTR